MPPTRNIMADDRKGKLIVLFILGLLLLNYPLLGIMDQKTLVWGFPKLYLYLFGVWLTLILAVRYIVRQKK